MPSKKRFTNWDLKNMVDMLHIIKIDICEKKDSLI